MARVLDLTRHAGVYATRLMVEAGHDVIRVESPAGDDLRHCGPFLGGIPDIEDGAYHQFFNAGKRSFALDVATPDGREAFERLARTADVIVANVPLPVDEERLRALRPDVVLVAITGEMRPELCAYARSGLLALTGQPGSAPVLMGGHIVYAATGTWVMVAAGAAMLVQQLTGEGQTVTVDIQECLETFLDHAVENFTARGRSTERRGQRGAVTPISGAFPSEDGFWLLSLHDSRERWESLMEWMQDPVLGNDASLLNYDERLKHCDMILDRIGTWARGFPKQDLVAEAQRRRIPCAPVNTSLELAADEQLIDRGFLVEVDHPQHGPMLFPRGALATVLDSTVGFAPKLGSANRELLGELGYT
jgi:crotonobetainyl-CoA:carnitine CoA-transferase CaiB-like acyl-CoA transferase